MRVLRLSNSNDINPAVSEELRSATLSASLFTAATGEPLDTVNRIIWPEPELPAILHRWMDKHTPDLVFFVVSSFWFTYESFPLRVERALGPLGKPVAQAGLKAAEFRHISQNRLFHATRRLALRTVGGATYFTPAEVLDRVEQCLRAILAHEDVILVVRGPVNAHSTDAGGRIAARARARWHVVDDGLRDLCERLYVHYLGFPGPADAGPESPSLQGDFVHLNEVGHQERAEQEAAALIAAWRAAHPAPP